MIDYHIKHHFLVVQSLSCGRLYATPLTAACQVSLSFTISQSLLKLVSIRSHEKGRNIANTALTQRLPWGNGTRNLNSHFLSQHGSRNPMELKGGCGSPTAACAKETRELQCFSMILCRVSFIFLFYSSTTLEITNTYHLVIAQGRQSLVTMSFRSVYLVTGELVGWVLTTVCIHQISKHMTLKSRKPRCLKTWKIPVVNRWLIVFFFNHFSFRKKFLVFCCRNWMSS